jgi:hypothetical protein
MPSVEPLGRAATALHHRQLAMHIGEAGGTLVPWVGEGGVSGCAQELHCTWHVDAFSNHPNVSKEAVQNTHPGQLWSGK